MKLPESQLPGEDMARVRIKRVGGGGGGVGGEERGEKGRNLERRERGADVYPDLSTGRRRLFSENVLF